ncbi:retrovirus-related pol polyprotein LINE-1 [Tanacetum coccineum]
MRSCPSSLGEVDGCRGTRRYDRLASSHGIRVGSWNIGSLTRNLLELGDTLGRHKFVIACFQETKWKGSRTKEGNGYKLWYLGSSRARNEVGVMLSTRLKDNVVQVTRRSDKIMAILDAVDEIVREYPNDHRLIIEGDLNDHIGAAMDGYERVHGGFGFGVRSKEGSTILEFATTHDLVRKGDLRACKDCRAFFGEACSSQHRLVILDALFKSQPQRREVRGRLSILWKNLNEEAIETFRVTVFEKLAALEEDMSASNADQMWNTLACVTKYEGKDSLGVARESARTYLTHTES